MFEAGSITLSADGTYILNQHSGVKQAIQQLKNATALESDADTTSPKEWLVSAPGKVILFGEHAVVHGVVSLMISV